MAKTMTQKILERHLITGEYRPGSEIGIHIDQTLTQDATGTMAYLQFEAMGLNRIRTDHSVSFVDHNTIQIGFENADDRRQVWYILFQGGERNMPSGASGKIRKARDDTSGFRQSYTHRRWHRTDSNRSGWFGRGVGHGR